MTTRGNYSERIQKHGTVLEKKLFFERAQETSIRFKHIFAEGISVKQVLEDKTHVWLLDIREAKIIFDYYDKLLSFRDKTKRIYKSKHAFLPLEEAVLFSRHLPLIVQKEIKSVWRTTFETGYYSYIEVLGYKLAEWIGDEARKLQRNDAFKFEDVENANKKAFLESIQQIYIAFLPFQIGIAVSFFACFFEMVVKLVLIFEKIFFKTRISNKAFAKKEKKTH